jgi:adenosylcobinamide-phosphate synthase
VLTPGPRAAGLILGSVLDALVADPRRWHPVALFGTAAHRLETAVYADSRRRGLAFSALATGSAAALGIVAERRATHPLTRTALTAAATWVVLGGTSLRRESAAVQGLLTAGDLPAARTRLTHLVGRDPQSLDSSEVARAALESVAENTSDAVVAPLVWGAVGGIPGLLGYRAVNTLDAMVGHRSQRYLRFGWASARLDDLANLVPARLTALLTAIAAPLVGGSGRRAAAIALRDARGHPSPNSGWCEAAFAGALDVRLGGRNTYGARIEDRPLLGDGRPATAADLDRANRLSRAVGTLAAAAAALTAIGLASRRDAIENRRHRERAAATRSSATMSD